MDEAERELFNRALRELEQFPSGQLVLGVVRRRANKAISYAVGACIIALIAVAVSLAASIAAYNINNRERAATRQLRAHNAKAFCTLIDSTRAQIVLYLQSFILPGQKADSGLQRGITLFKVPACRVNDNGRVNPVPGSTITRAHIP